MGADLHIHIYKNTDESVLRAFFSHTLGSKYFSWGRQDHDAWSKAYSKISETPNIWIGAVSWLKAGLLDDDETFVPDTVAKISELVGEEKPVLDDSMLQNILDAFDLPNTTGYRLAEKANVEKFLRSHMGEQLFTVSW